MVLALTAAPLAAHATPVALDHGGQQGVWFPAAEAEKLLHVLTVELPTLKTQLAEQTQMSALVSAQLDTLERSIKLERAISKQHEEMSAYWRKNYLDETARKSGLFSDPSFLLGVGWVLGAATTIGIAAAVKQL